MHFRSVRVAPSIRQRVNPVLQDGGSCWCFPNCSVTDRCGHPNKGAWRAQQFLVPVPWPLIVTFSSEDASLAARVWSARLHVLPSPEPPSREVLLSVFAIAIVSLFGWVRAYCRFYVYASEPIVGTTVTPIVQSSVRINNETYAALQSYFHPFLAINYRSVICFS